jgi:hypothetical protein
MSSFHHRSNLLRPHIESSAQAGRDAEATPSLSLPPLRSIHSLPPSATHAAQGSGPTAQSPSANLPPITQYCPQLPGISQHHRMSLGLPSGNFLNPATSAVQMNVLPHPALGSVAQLESNCSIAGERHKKEVKRRTKTGCLTCRKRRIKVSQVSRSNVVGCSRCDSAALLSRA